MSAGFDLGFSDVGGFRTLFGGHDVEFNRVIFREAFEAFALDRGEMHEHIRRAIFRSDEAEPFCVIEPLYFTFGSHVVKYLYCFKFPGVLGGILDGTKPFGRRPCLDEPF